MAKGKLHYCINGISVTDQVLLYQASKTGDNYIPIKEYYDNFKEPWYKQLSDYMDRSGFDSEFNYKLCRAVDSFDYETAQEIASKYGWSTLGMFNRYFYSILSHWKSNVKTSSYRIKKRPPVQCPVCHRYVSRIDAEHLQHYKTTSDLPRVVVWHDNIYEVCCLSKMYIYTWGKKTNRKLNDLLDRKTSDYKSERHRVRWPWFCRDGDRGVLCPFTKKIIPQITNDYLRSLPAELSRYAPVYTWEQFIEKYPMSLIQAEVYSLDFLESHSSDDEGFLRDHVAATMDGEAVMDYEKINNNDFGYKYESVFQVIDEYIKDKVDQDVLKLIAIGYSNEDIADTLDIEKKEVKWRIRGIKDSHPELQQKLLV